MPNFIKEIVSGGQTGVDRAALDVAMALQINHGGWCPFGRKAEDGIIPYKYHLEEAQAPTFAEKNDADAIYKKRTELNARDSDGTLIIVKDPPMGGTQYTIEMAAKYHKPYFFFYLFTKQSEQIDELINWILTNDIHKLNVAGPRASQTQDIYNEASKVLKQIFSHPILQQDQAYQQTFITPIKPNIR